MTADDLTAMSLAEVRAGLDDRDFSVVELTEAYLRRIDEYSWLRAYVHVDVGGARAVANELDRELRAGRHRGALHGIPVGIKDAFPIRGLPLTLGSVAIDVTPAADCELVARLRAAGAVILGTQTMTEAGLGDPVRSGPQATGFNPRNLEYLTGASSTGSGVAVVAGLALVSIGADGGGSVRIPAAATGVLGFKPTNRRMSLDGGVPWAWSVESAGVLARDMAGIEAAFQATAQSGDVVPVTASPRLRALPEASLGHLTDDVRDGYRELCAALGAVTGPPVDALAGVGPQWNARMKELHPVHSLRMVAAGERYSACIQARYEDWGGVTREAYLASFEYEARLDAEIARALDGHDALVLPTSPLTGLRWGEWPGEPPFAWFRFCQPFNMTRQPAITAPWRLDGEGLPICFQVVGRRDDDERLLGVARWCVERTGFDAGVVSPQRTDAMPA